MIKNLIVLVLSVPLLTGCAFINLSNLASSSIEETIVEESAGYFVADKVLLIDVSGEISDYGDSSLFGSSAACTPYYIKSILNKAEKDSFIKAVILRIDSPGGSVTASSTIAREIKRFKQKTGLPVYAYINGLGCSGAYYISAPCDKIYIQPDGLTGSIGVIMMLPKFMKLAEKVGYEMVVIKSAAMKDIGNSFRDMTEEEKQVFQSIIDSSYGNFLSWIMECRPKATDMASLKTVADGRIYDAKQALDRKIVDKICFLEDAIADVKQAARMSDANVVTYGYIESDDANIYSPAGASQKIKLMNVNIPGNRRAGFYYMWMPGE